MIGKATPAQRAAMENKAAQMRNKNAQADRSALARRVAKEMGEDVRSPKVAKEVEKRQQGMAKKQELSRKVAPKAKAEVKNTPSGGDPKAKTLESRDKEWEAKRSETYKSLKGKTKEELLSTLNQNQRIHGLSLKDSMGDLKSAIVGSIHGNASPSERANKRANDQARIERRREAARQEEESPR